jgi:hypothetical protein
VSLPHPEEVPQLPNRRGTLDAARMYWDNLARLGSPGQPLESSPLVQMNIQLASTAALVSIAESLAEVAAMERNGDRRWGQLLPVIATALKDQTKEIVKQRTMFSKTVRS